MTIGTLIKRLRDELGLTQEQMAVRMDITQGWISRLESRPDYILAEDVLLVRLWRLSKSPEASNRMIDFLEHGALPRKGPKFQQ